MRFEHVPSLFALGAAADYGRRVAARLDLQLDPIEEREFEDGEHKSRPLGWSGMGPSLFAYRPWMDKKGTPFADGAHLKTVTLLLYPNSRETESTSVSMRGFHAG